MQAHMGPVGVNEHNYVCILLICLHGYVCCKLSSVLYVHVHVHLGWGREPGKWSCKPLLTLQTPDTGCPGKLSSEGVTRATPLDSRPHLLTVHTW